MPDNYMFIEAVAILPIDEPVPDEWLNAFDEAEEQRVNELYDLFAWDGKEYYRKPIKP